MSKCVGQCARSSGYIFLTLLTSIQVIVKALGYPSPLTSLAPIKDDNFLFYQTFSVTDMLPYFCPGQTPVVSLILSS